jgi:hypothetical protein
VQLRGCYVNIRNVLAHATREAEDRPLRAVIIVGDAFHDDPDGLDEAAISANQLRRAGTRVFLIQWQAMSAYTTGGEEAVKATCGQAATLLLEHLKQAPMSVI